MSIDVVRTGKRGSIVIPAHLRRKLNIDEGTLLAIEEADGGLVVRPATVRRRLTDAEVEAFWDEMDAAYDRLRADPDAWAEEMKERKLWDATLMDGLDPDETWEDVPRDATAEPTPR